MLKKFNNYAMQHCSRKVQIMLENDLTIIVVASRSEWILHECTFAC